MDIFSILIFFIYTILILIILLYISPLISALVLVFVPLASIYLLPEETIGFFSTEQFSFAGISIQNIHILLSVWSALIAVIAYTEIVSWYLLREEKPKPKKVSTAVSAVKTVPNPGQQQKPLKNWMEELLLKLGKIMSGK